MSVVSGIAGLLADNASAIHAVGKWSISSTKDIKKIYNTATDGGPVTLDGNDDWSGTYEASGALPSILPGAAFAFEGSIDGTNGATGTAIVDSVTINWDIEGGEPIKHTVAFSGNGALTLGAEVAAVDSDVFEGASSIGTQLEIAAAIAVPEFADIVDVRTMSLTITRNNQAYVSTETSGDTKRIIGNFDCTLTATVYASDWSTLPQPGDVKHVRMYADNTLFWELKWMTFSELTNLEVDRETAALVGATLNATFNGATDVGGTPTQGYVKTPESSPTTVWP